MAPAPQTQVADHRVVFHESDAVLADCVASFLHPATASGAAVIVATPAHSAAFLAALRGTGAAGRLLVADAEETLARFLVDGMPSPPLFDEVIGGLLDEALAVGGPVRVYGEMVSVLWQEGRIDAAMELEAMWNEAGASRPFSLLCGYPSALFGTSGDADLFTGVCSHHTDVTLPPEEALTRLASQAQIPEADRAVGWRFAADLRAGGQARAQLRELLGHWRLSGVTDEVELLATELVNNAIVHARSPVRMSVRLGAGVLRVEVSDTGEGTIQPSDPTPTATHGRGLMLIDAMANAWGTAVDSAGKTVWFELPAPAGTPGR